MKNLINLKKVIEEISINEGWLYAKTDIDIEDDAKVFFYSADLNQSPQDELQVRELFFRAGFSPYLSKEDVEDIIENLEQQVELPTIVDYINAIRFYKKHDAFIVM
ncbi:MULTISPECIES: DUF7716 domain-containing protein [unclassified Delftia]|uniref:DUF7716 domain-containing protein n=1 Tax=unclassified Delftia TaxID=2613839 RepID=UPI001901B340|nr:MULTISPECIES: hypothetical protein [unclassified Delftia]MBK0115778.1 hypothetical protein [Delftia sp. S65]MBK0121644.1 hypothetical protein [Delftia sp. S67]MBK0131583.1 hypothetical protein [Delftia sp. S66]